MSKVAINGLGRIGRATLKILMDNPGLDLVAVNDVIPKENLAYLLNHDSVYHRYNRQVKFDQSRLLVGEKAVKVYSEKNPAELPWGDLEIDVVFECSGVFRRKEDLERHLQAGAKTVILSAPAKSGDVLTVVHGVNSPENRPKVLSCASCTTNCIAPVVEIMGRRIGVRKATLTTIHAYTSSQTSVDGPRNKWRRGRAAAINFVPTTTGAAKATTKILSEFEGKFDGIAIRGPVPVGSLADLVFLTLRETSIEEINAAFEDESASERYRGILGVTDVPIVSSDIIQDPHASIVDLTMTRVVDGDLVKIMSWYDNEWGYSCQMVREAARLIAK